MAVALTIALITFIIAIIVVIIIVIAIIIVKWWIAFFGHLTKQNNSIIIKFIN